jgi:hypothetical protein
MYVKFDDLSWYAVFNIGPYEEMNKSFSLKNNYDWT